MTSALGGGCAIMLYSPGLPHPNMELASDCDKTQKHSEATLRSTFSATKLADLALAGFHPRVFLVDHVNAAMPAHDAAILVAKLRGL